MKRIIKYAVSLLTVVVLTVTVFIIVKLNKKFPDEIVYGKETQIISDNGMYFVKDNRLCFIDNATGKEVIVCNRANCEHNDKTCNAYVPGMGIEMLIYQDYIYVSYFDNDVSWDENGEMSYEGNIKLIRIRNDGAKRKEIYSAASGAILSMMAMGDTIYFTAYTMHGEFQVNVYNLDNAIYAYNIRWDRLKRIKNYDYTEGRCMEGVEIIGGRVPGTLYIDHDYIEGDTGLGNVKNVIEEVNLDTGTASVLRTFDNVYPQILIDEGNKYLATRALGDVNKITIWECDNSFVETKELFTAKEARIDQLGGYMHVVASDYKKALYDYKENRWYIANTSFSDEGTYMSILYMVDRDNNVVYIDATDYTGYKPGDFLPGDISNNAVRDWSVFLEENFIPYEDLTEEQRESLTWIEIKEGI